VHPGDGLHARFTRACALHAAQLMRTMLQAGVPGNAGGLLRAHAQQQATMPHGQPWPAGWVQRLDADAVQQRVPGLRADNAWWFPGGGWVAAADAVRWLLQTPGVRFQGRAAVHTLQRTGNDWHLLDASGHTLAHAQAVVLATAGAWPLLRCNGAPGAPQPAALPPPRYSRGQITWFDTPATLPHPVAGHGYALSGHAGQLLCGASTEPVGPPDPGAHAGDNRDAEPRDSDHQFNLQRLATLTGIAPPPGAPLHGRVGWRHLTMDRLPLVGAVPGAVQAQRIERLRDVAREPNLWLLAGLGGRGFTWAPLLGEVVAALAGAGPLPMETGLLDAADPARHMLRQARRAAAG
jgi:tRNA 5-methylaminomethyl-2-thiouridine biosynthesis bifunctional protein